MDRRYLTVARNEGDQYLTLATLHEIAVTLATEEIVSVLSSYQVFEVTEESIAKVRELTIRKTYTRNGELDRIQGIRPDDSLAFEAYCPTEAGIPEA